ncbi:hypothetical protein CspHIS471_0202720 [Cutaneotrichosporon sp. HIS471]|nr:hypothetical protein CspHIS471_0202720 [Cutaneotrichosporon sp. HIS471]
MSHSKDIDDKGFELEQQGRRLSTGVTADDVLNPLTGMSRDQLMADADAFVDNFGFQADRDTFRLGALVAQRPKEFESIDSLSDDDKVTLASERDHIWRQPRALIVSVVVCALGAATQGWDQTGSNGANLSFPLEFGIGAAEGQPGWQADEWTVGLVNGSVYLSAALVGAWLSDPLNHYFGRRGEIFITGIVLVITPIASGFTRTWEQLTAVRLIMGVGVGAKAATVPMYCAELSPARIRGALTMGWQLWTAFGIFLGFCANAAVMNTGKIAWRLQLGSAFIPAVPLTLFVYCCPESPRWLMKKGRMMDAWKAMKRVRHTELQAARDLFYAYVLYSEEQKIVQGATYFTRLVELFTIPRCRRATVAAGVVMLAQQMCGINIMAFYSSTIFKRGGFTDKQALFASIGFGALNFVFAIPAVFTIDTYGRRALLLTTFPIMCITLLIGGFMFLIDNLVLSTGLVALFVYLFTIAYSVGEGPVPFMYSAEVFPLAQREQGMAWSVCVCFFWGAVLSFTFPIMLRTFTPTGAFVFYAGLNALAFFMIFLWVPETKQLTLEELDQTFSVKTSTYIKHNIRTVLPWWFKRYILRKKDIGPCPPIQIERPRRLSLVQTFSHEAPSIANGTEKV